MNIKNTSNKMMCDYHLIHEVTVEYLKNNEIQTEIINQHNYNRYTHYSSRKMIEKDTHTLTYYENGVWFRPELADKLQKYFEKYEFITRIYFSSSGCDR